MDEIEVKKKERTKVGHLTYEKCPFLTFHTCEYGFFFLVSMNSWIFLTFFCLFRKSSTPFAWYSDVPLSMTLLLLNLFYK
jgi:hypothetical protein